MLCDYFTHGHSCDHVRQANARHYPQPYAAHAYAPLANASQARAQARALRRAMRPYRPARPALDGLLIVLACATCFAAGLATDHALSNAGATNTYHQAN